MYLREDEKQVGRENFQTAIGSKLLRREFLLKAIPPGASSKGLFARYYGYEKPKEPLKVALIGVGQQGQRLIAALNQEYMTIVAIADLRPYSKHTAIHGDLTSRDRGGLAKVYEWKEEPEKKVKQYGPYQELLENAKADGVEAVIIALPTHLHAKAAIAAMNAGLHVFLETPLARNTAECKEILRVAEKKKEDKVTLAIGHQRRYSALYDNAAQVAKTGLMGPLHYIRAEWNCTAEEDPEKQLKKAIKDAEESLKKADGAKAKNQQKKLDALKAQFAALTEDKKIDAAKANYKNLGELLQWRQFERTSGGLMNDLGTQLVDGVNLFVQAMLAKDEPVLPLAVVGCSSQMLEGGDVEDHAYCVLEFPIQGYVAGPVPKAEKKIGLQFAIVRGNGFEGYGETVLGTAGSLVLNREKDAMLYKVAAVSNKVRVIEKKDKEATSLVFDDRPDDESEAIGRIATLRLDPGYAAELEHWASLVRNPEQKTASRATAKDALATAVIVGAAIQAAKTGARVEFEKEWFDLQSDATPEDLKPDLKQYA